ncbi:thap domain-containing protein 9 [Holotrichia oblita]|uniref:Thap domain-containing protein 9 n=1 Tax=Holotrichia oblita TaxID=644536 RepID=A0ACB9T8N9_HOLOL|nr:thap domain-containing protein 9 [Holotrichia oblita]
MVGVCVVKHCYGTKTSMHRFPNPEKDMEMFKKWVELCGSSELLNIAPTTIYKNRRICRVHFEDTDFGPNNHLLRTAYPKLQLPNMPSCSKSLDEPEASSTKNVHTDVLSTLAEGESSALQESSTLAITVTHTDVLSAETEDAHHDTQFTGLSTNRKRKHSSRGKECGILSDVNVSRVTALSPKAKYFYNKLKYYKKKHAANKKNVYSLKQRLQNATKYASTEQFRTFCSTLDEVQMRFFKSQILNSRRKPSGRRFTLQDKVLALALYKQSGNGYKLLSKLFTLPSPKTVIRLLKKVPVHPGINQSVLDVLSAEAKAFTSPLDKYCVLVFDEMSILPHLAWNEEDDAVVGFERDNHLIANHAQVFMLRGINKNWKQPIYFDFVNGATKNFKIMSTIKEIVRKTKEAGLEIIATVCDQGTNNVSAITTLVKDTHAAYQRRGEEFTDFVFEIDDMTIIPLFDVPHLMKGIRNNFLTANVEFKKDGRKMEAKWEHIMTAWKIDSTLGSLRAMPKLTSAHVDPMYIKKMKVANCTQVLSRSVAVAINLMAISGASVNLGEGIVVMPKDAAETAKFIEFCDLLFDSLNGASNGETLRASVTLGSQHVEFWKEAISILSETKFKTKKGYTVPPTIKNCIKTLKNFILLFGVMGKIGFKSMAPRRFNQDCLENFFGAIRQRGARFTNPTATAFIPFYKSLLVNNFTVKHSIGSNCEDDRCNMLVTLEKFINQVRYFLFLKAIFLL